MADNEFTADLVTIEDEDGVTHTFEELDRIETDDGKYLALTPVYDDAEEILDGDGELIIVKVNEQIAKIASLYLERLKTIFEFVIPKPLILYNTMNVPIYHFVFASNNSTAVKIAKDIIGK